MSGSSGLRENAFEGIQWANVISLLEVVRECKLSDEWHIETQYRQRAMNYSRCAAFLEEIGIIARQHDRVICTCSVPSRGKIPDLVLQQIVGSKNRYRAEAFRYLRRYRLSAGEVVHHADASTRSKQSPVRNFLMDLGIIRHRVQGDDYVVDPAFMPLYAQARQAKGGCSPARMTSRSAEREEIGLKAEIAVVALEHERLGPTLANRVEHISLRNAMAGYDILSATATPHAVLPRYIEVKANATGLSSQARE